MPVTTLVTGVSRSRAATKEDNMTTRSGPFLFGGVHNGARRLGHHRSSRAKDADDSVAPVHGLGYRCVVGCVAFDNMEVGIGDGQLLPGPNECRDDVSRRERLLDQRNA